MSKLWVRLSVTFCAILIVGVVAILALVVNFNRSATIQSLLVASFNTEGGPVDWLGQYYQRTGSWEGVNDLISEAMQVFGYLNDEGLGIALADADGQIIYDLVGSQLGEDLPDLGNANVLPIMVNGETVGYLRLRLERSSILRATVQHAVLNVILQTLVIVVIIGGAFGIGAGIIASRWLTAPLMQLAETATAIRQGQRHRRAVPAGSDEVRELAHAFNTMIDAQQAGEKQRQQLVADIAHELRTPLSVLQGNLYATLEGLVQADSATVARLYDQTRLLSRLVNDLHELSQAEARTLRLDRQAIDVGAALADICDSFQPVAESKAVHLVLDVPPALPALHADSGRLQQVMHNLLANALRYTPAGGQIAVGAKAMNGSVEIRVADTGSGIAPEHLPHIFERFYRADPSRDRASGGSGLGLAIARAIVEAHGGTIRASSGGPGAGSEITICWPTA